VVIPLASSVKRRLRHASPICYVASHRIVAAWRSIGVCIIFGPVLCRYVVDLVVIRVVICTCIAGGLCFCRKERKHHDKRHDDEIQHGGSDTLAHNFLVLSSQRVQKALSYRPHVSISSFRCSLLSRELIRSLYNLNAELKTMMVDSFVETGPTHWTCSRGAEKDCSRTRDDSAHDK
jgi:hypothetical protein